MNYINIETLEYPITELSIRAQINDPKSQKLMPDNFQHVFPTKQPFYNPVTSKIIEVAPIYEFGGYYQKWEVSSKFTDSIELGTVEEQETKAIEEDIANTYRISLKKIREAAKEQRQVNVDSIIVTTTAGNSFNGDEISQNRMARAILALQSTGTPAILWVLADNLVIQASIAELSEALALSGAAQAAMWVVT